MANEKGLAVDEKSNFISETETPRTHEKRRNVDGKSDIVSEPDTSPVDSRPPSYSEV